MAETGEVEAMDMSIREGWYVLKYKPSGHGL